MTLEIELVNKGSEIVSRLEVESDQMAELHASRLRGEHQFKATAALYESLTGEQFPVDLPEDDGWAHTPRSKPRVDQLLMILRDAARPMTVRELSDAMPDRPTANTITAAAHRAESAGQLRRVRRGVYEAVVAVSSNGARAEEGG